MEYMPLIQLGIAERAEEEKFYISKYTYFMMPLQRAKKTAYDNISQLLEEDIDKDNKIII